VEILPTRESQQVQQGALPQIDPNAAIIERLRALQADYFMPATAELRRSLRTQIRATELDLVERILAARDAELTAQLNAVLHKLDMLHSQRETTELTREREGIVRAIEVHQTVRQALRQGQSLPFFLYRLYFGSVFNEHDGFDIVIANPPYVSIENMKPEIKETLKKTYTDVAAGRGDLYTYFYARALQLLRPGGTLAFITSNKFFRAGYGKGLLKTLATKTTMRTIIDFGDAPVFDAAAYPCIVITDNEPPSANHTYAGLTTPAGYKYAELDKLDAYFMLEHQNLEQGNGVHPPSGSQATSDLVNKLLSLGSPLMDYVGERIYYGIKTGRTEAFIINQATYDRLIAEDPNSVQVLKPLLRGRDISRYSISYNGSWLIYTYHGIDISKYPAIENYLSPFRERLEGRATRQAWYELQQPQQAYEDAYASPKIISLRFGLKTGFTFDEKGYFCNDAIYTIATQKRWLAAVINSSLCNLCLISLCPTVQNGYSQFFINKIGQIPIIEPTPADQQRLTAIVDELQALRGQGPQAAALEREVDAIVYKTYGLTPEEQAEIETWHAERRRQLATPRAPTMMKRPKWRCP
ncbi:MAG: Eco57I restriction-modification methylase domain-containing protein, partial [Ktedonobacterales bacterium]|nr:Eco57I restriction-modification methylase domain-containing protein [Ktedonobacterales bacterium]